MEQEYSQDEIKMKLQNYFKNDFDYELPSDTKKAIENAFSKINMLDKMRKIKRVAAIIICAITVTSGVVFADDIIKYVSSIFNNSTEAIDIATQNGYIQSVNMDFVYDKDVGIRVDNIIMDSSKMDISYLYKVNNNTTALELYEYSIKDNENRLLYKTNRDSSVTEVPLIVKEMSRTNKPIKLENNIINESILYFSNEFPKCEKLFIEINSVRLNYQDIVEGNWKIEVNVADKFNEREKIIYEPSYNEHIIQSEIYLTETTLKVSLEIDVLYEEDFVFYKYVTLENKFNKEFNNSIGNCEKLEKSSKFNIEFDVSKYDENIDTLYLTIPIDENVVIKLQLNKK